MTMDKKWPVLLFKKSLLKQRKFREIEALLGRTENLCCLDIGSDNGVISYLLRNRGGSWKSADLGEKAVDAIRSVVKDNVFKIDGVKTPFQDDEFDLIVIVDFLEHIRTDREFVEELFRILKPEGELIINVPHMKNSLLRKFRLAIGQTDEKHGHIKPGYMLNGLTELTKGKFSIQSSMTYSKFFSELIDTVINIGLGFLKKGVASTSKGQIVTGKDIEQYRKSFWLYSLIYPVAWMFSKLDHILFFVSGYMLIVKFKTCKESRP